MNFFTVMQQLCVGPIWPYTTFERAVKIPSALVTLQSMGFFEVLIQEIPSTV